MADKDKHGNKTDRWDVFNPGYAVAGIAALWGAYESVQKKFFNNMYGWGILKAQREDRNAGMQKIFDTEGKSTLRATIAKMDLVHDKYEEILTPTLESKGIHDVFDEWRTLLKYQKIEVAFKVAVIISIGLGAVYGFSRNRKLAHELNQQEKENAKLQQQHNV